MDLENSIIYYVVRNISGEEIKIGNTGKVIYAGASNIIINEKVYNWIKDKVELISSPEYPKGYFLKEKKSNI